MKKAKSTGRGHFTLLTIASTLANSWTTRSMATGNIPGVTARFTRVNGLITR
jgi:hypothetical protein